MSSLREKQVSSGLSIDRLTIKALEITHGAWFQIPPAARVSMLCAYSVSQSTTPDRVTQSEAVEIAKRIITVAFHEFEL
jgi:hypothetical protein